MIEKEYINLKEEEDLLESIKKHVKKMKSLKENIEEI